MNTKLNHIGIAVADLPRLKLLFHCLNLKIEHQEVVSEQGVNTHFLPLALGITNLELLEPLPDSPEGPIAAFLKKKGPGIHHLSFEVPKGNLDPLSRVLLENGFNLIYPVARPGAHGMRVNFIHPSTAGGMLIEIMEPIG